MVEERTEKIEALETLVDFNGRILQNLPIISKELSGARLADTDVFLKDILNAINWEIQVVNATLDLINENECKLDKDEFNKCIIALSEAVDSNDDNKMSEAFTAIIPVFENLGKVVKETIG